MYTLRSFSTVLPAFVSSVAAIMLLSSAPLSSAAAADATCKPMLISMRTDFPSSAQQQNAHGTVLLSVNLSDTGRAIDASIVKSSGNNALDNAAKHSVVKHWRFAVDQCSASDLRQAQTVAVTFERPKLVTLHGTRDAKSVRAMNTLRASSGCNIAQTESSTEIYSCAPALTQLSDRATADASTGGR